MIMYVAAMDNNITAVFLCPIGYARRIKSDLSAVSRIGNDKIFYISFTSLSHMSKWRWNVIYRGFCISYVKTKKSRFGIKMSIIAYYIISLYYITAIGYLSDKNIPLILCVNKPPGCNI